MKVKNYVIILVFTLAILFLVFETKYSESKFAKDIKIYNEEIYDAIDTICNVNLDYNINNLKMVSENFTSGVEGEDLQRYIECFTNENTIVDTNTYFVMENGFFITTKSDSHSMYEVFNQEEIEEINQLYDEVKKSLTYSRNNRFVKSDDGYSLYMGMPIFDDSNKFVGVIINDFSDKQLQYILDYALGDDNKTHIKIYNNDTLLAEHGTEGINQTIGGNILDDRTITCYNLTVVLSENLNRYSNAYGALKVIIVICFLIMVLDFIVGIIKTQKNEQNIRALYVILGIGLGFVIMNMIGYYMFASNLEDVKTDQSFRFTQLLIQAESHKNERDLICLSNLIDDSKYIDRIDKDNFIKYIDDNYGDILKIAFKNIETLNNIYVYDKNGNIKSYPEKLNGKYHILPEKYYKEALDNARTVFFKDMTDINTQMQSSFIIRPYIVDGELIGSIAFVYDDDKILNIIRDNDFIKSIKKYVASRDGKLTSLDGAETKNIFTDYDFSNNGVWDNGSQTTKGVFEYTIKNSKRIRKMDYLSTRYTTDLICFSNSQIQNIQDTIKGILINIFLYAGMSVFIFSVLFQNKRRVDTVEKVTKEEIKL